MDKRKRIGRSMNTAVAGIDIGESNSETCYMLPDGDIGNQFSFPMTDEGFREFASKIPLNTRIAFEASGLAYAVMKKLTGLGYSDITVAHPRELSWIAKSKRKNDRVDSQKLAKLHLVHMIPEAHLLGEDERILRDILIQRVKLGKSIANTKNSIIGYLKREDLYNALPKTNDSFSVKRRNAIRSISFHNAKDLVIVSLMDRLELYERQSLKFGAEIKKRAQPNEDVRILMSIPGIDYYLASLISSYIGNIERFENADKLAVFFGIVPATRDSSSIKRRGHMSKEGAANARWALSIAVDTVMVRNKPIKQYYDTVKERKQSGKLAHVCTMRKLTRMMYKMLKERRLWKYDNPNLTENKLSRLDEE